jgi:hypothetical protein
MSSVDRGHEGAQNLGRQFTHHRPPMRQPPTHLHSKCWIVPHGVSDCVPDGVLDEVSNELPDGGSDCEFTLLHIDHTLDPHKHQIKLNLTQNHCKTLITHTYYKSMMN